MSRVLFAAEHLLPARGGAERYALELLSELAGRGHDVRALWVDDGMLAAGGAAPRQGDGRARPSAGRSPAATEGGAAVDRLPGAVRGHTLRARVAGGHWAERAARRSTVGEAVRTATEEERPDVVVTQLHAAPGAIAAAAAAGVASVLLLPSYDALCRYAFDAGSACGRLRDCARCPRARALPDGESAALRAGRTEHERSLAEATVLLAPSEAVAAAVEAWCGRRPEVAAPVAGATEPARARAGGHILLAAGRWSPNKGADLLPGLVAALRGHDVVVTPAGLGADARRALGAAGDVWFMDAPIDRLLDGAAVCLVPSRWPEPFGRVAFEAQAAGVPVLAAAVGGLPAIVPAEALLAPSAGAEEWAAAVRALEPPDAWLAAHRAAHAAAGAVVDARPLERAVAVVEDAASAARRGPGSASG